MANPNNKNQSTDRRTKGKKQFKIVIQGGGKNPRGAMWRNFLSTILLILAVLILYSAITEGRSKNPQISISELAQNISAGEISKITVEGSKLTADYSDGVVKESKKESDIALSETLVNYGVTAEELRAVELDIKEQSGFVFWLVNFAPALHHLFPMVLVPSG